MKTWASNLRPVYSGIPAGPRSGPFPPPDGPWEVLPTVTASGFYTRY